MLPLLVLVGGVALQPAAAIGDTMQAGVSSAVRGSVDLRASQQSDAEPQAVETGDPVFILDEIITGADSGMQLLLLDETTFTIGANSTLIVDEFIYDPATSEGEVGASLLGGTVRFVSGQVARNEPDNMEISLPSGTLGVRGTMAVVTADDDTVMVLLDGPGGGDPESGRGIVEVSNAGVTVVLWRSGYATVIVGDQPPSAPFLLDAEARGLIQSALEGGVAPSTEETVGPGGPGAAAESGFLALETIERLLADQGMDDILEQIQAAEPSVDVTRDPIREEEEEEEPSPPTPEEPPEEEPTPEEPPPEEPPEEPPEPVDFWEEDDWDLECGEDVECIDLCLEGEVDCLDPIDIPLPDEPM